MKYAHLFWTLFGVPVTGWDGLLFEDFQWMRRAAEDHHLREQQREVGKR